MEISFFKVLDGTVTATNIKYIAKTNNHFDLRQELNLVIDYRFQDIDLGLFEGRQQGKTIQCLCSFSDIDIIKAPQDV